MTALDILSTYTRVESAVCDETGLTDAERQAHIRNITNVVMRARANPLPYARKPEWALIAEAMEFVKAVQA